MYLCLHYVEWQHSNAQAMLESCDTQVSFLDATSTPCKVVFAQTCSLSKGWQELGCMQLRRDDRQQLQHVFRLSAQHSIQRFLRISFSGHLLGQPSGQLPLAVRTKESHTLENCLSLWHLSSVCASQLACNADPVAVMFVFVLRATSSL